jgi:RimJ/RimL family protein N-acetyltransferase
MDFQTRSQRIDKLGEPFEAGKCEHECLPEVIDMYDAFAPKTSTQGLPPADEETRHTWVRGLFQSAENFAVWKDGKVVGHCVLLIDMERLDAEYLIFVLGPQQNRGLGTVLTQMAVQRGIQLGLQVLWLTVEAYNFRAIRMYRNAGFQFCDECNAERTMMRRL